MLKRVLTAVVLIAVMALGIWLQGWFLRAILLVIMLACTWEVYHALRIAGQRPAEWTGYLFCALAATAQAIAGVAPGGGFGRMLVAVGPPAFALTVGVLVAMAVIILRGKVDFEAMQSTLFPMVYPGLFFCLILGLQDLHDPAAATLALVLTFFVASVNDTFALFVGVKFGRHRLSPEISPKKSVEGSVAGLVASVLFALLAAAVAAKVAPGAPLPPLWAFGLLGLVAGGLSQIGDLVASLVKRHCGIKDFSNIFPGHGGMLDRLDGILFCGAACWLFFKAFGF